MDEIQPMRDAASASRGHYEMQSITASSRNPDKAEKGQLERQHSKTSTYSHQPQQMQDGSKRSGWRITLILIALFLSLFISALDALIVGTALPVISHDLVSATGYTWVGGAYLLATCAAGPIWAKLSDIWGRRPILLSGIAVFMAGSIICATAQTMTVMILGRAIQGSASGAIILLVHICISDLFSVHQRTLIIGWTEGVWASAAATGPILGGVFATLVSWRWCFWINVPICGVSFLLTLLFLDIKHEKTSLVVGLKSIDWFGIGTFLGFTLMLLLGLDFGGAIFPWSSAKVIALLVTGSILVFVFVYGEAKIARYPLMPLAMFKNWSNVACLLVVFFHGMVFIGSDYYLPLYFQSVLGVTPLVSGLMILPFLVWTAIAGITCGFVIHRTGRFRELTWVGTILLCLGTGLYLSWGVTPSLGKIVGFQVISGTGSGLLFEPPLIAIQSQVSQQDVATATSTLTFIRNVAVSLCVIVGGAVFQNSMDARADFLAQAGLPSSVLQQLSGAEAAANVMVAETLSDSAQVFAVKEAFTWSVRNMFIMYTALGFCGVLASLFVKRSHLATEHVETVTGIRHGQDQKG